MQFTLELHGICIFIHRHNSRRADQFGKQCTQSGLFFWDKVTYVFVFTHKNAAHISVDDVLCLAYLFLTG